MQEQLSEVFIYIKGVLQYKWFAIMLAWIICLLGWALVMQLPNKYTSEAKVHVDTKTLLQPLLRGIAIQQDGQGLVILMRKLMFTVPNLKKIILLSNLDASVTNDLERAKLYENMKKDILIRGGGDGLFNISYEANAPDLAKNVVTAVLTIFSEQTQLSTLEDVSSSQRFIELQISEYEVRLRNAEKAKEAFKRANFGLLPGEGTGQIGKLNATYEQLEMAKLGLSQAISKRDVLTKQMQEVVDAGDAWNSSDLILILSPEDQQIKDLQLMRMDLLLKYTEAHPAVSTIELTLKELLKRKEQKDKEMTDSGLPNAGALANPYVQQLKIALDQAEADVASKSTRIEYLKQKIEKLKSQLNSRLTVETEMQNINRDYNAISQNYQALIERREQARMSEKVDTETVSIKFKIADPPNKPLSPSGPNRLLLLSVVLCMGLGAGYGLAFLFFYIKPTYVTSKQLRDVTGLPLLGSISKQVLDGSKDKIKIFMYVSVMGGLFFVFFGLMSFEYLRLQDINLFDLIDNTF